MEDGGGDGPMGRSQVDEAEGKDIQDGSGDTALEEMGYIDSGGARRTGERSESASTLERIKALVPLFVLVGMLLLFAAVWVL